MNQIAEAKEEERERWKQWKQNEYGVWRKVTGIGDSELRRNKGRGRQISKHKSQGQRRPSSLTHRLTDLPVGRHGNTLDFDLGVTMVFVLGAGGVLNFSGSCLLVCCHL